jgi:hypothetical protein
MKVATFVSTIHWAENVATSVTLCRYFRLSLKNKNCHLCDCVDNPWQPVDALGTEKSVLGRSGKLELALRRVRRGITFALRNVRIWLSWDSDVVWPIWSVAEGQSKAWGLGKDGGRSDRRAGSEVEFRGMGPVPSSAIMLGYIPYLIELNWQIGNRCPKGPRTRCARKTHQNTRWTLQFLPRENHTFWNEKGCYPSTSSALKNNLQILACTRPTATRWFWIATTANICVRFNIFSVWFINLWVFGMNWIYL